MSQFRVKNIQLLHSPIKSDLNWSKSHAQVPRYLILQDKILVYFATRGEPDLNGNYKSYIGGITLDKQNPYKVLSRNNVPVFSPGNNDTFYQHGVMPGHVEIDGNRVNLYFTGWSRQVEKYPYETWIGKVTSFNLGQTFDDNTVQKIISKSDDNKYLSNGPHIYWDDETCSHNILYASGDDWIYDNGRWESVYSLKMSPLKNLKCIKKMTAYNLNVCENAPYTFKNNGHTHCMFSVRSSLNFRDGNGYKLNVGTILGGKINDVHELVFDHLAGWCDEMQCYASVLSLASRQYVLFSGNYFGREGFGIGELYR